MSILKPILKTIQEIKHTASSNLDNAKEMFDSNMRINETFYKIMNYTYDLTKKYYIKSIPESNNLELELSEEQILEKCFLCLEYCNQQVKQNKRLTKDVKLRLIQLVNSIEYGRDIFNQILKRNFNLKLGIKHYLNIYSNKIYPKILYTNQKKFDLLKGYPVYLTQLYHNAYLRCFIMTKDNKIILYSSEMNIMPLNIKNLPELEILNPDYIYVCWIALKQNRDTNNNFTYKTHQKQKNRLYYDRYYLHHLLTNQNTVKKRSNELCNLEILVENIITPQDFQNHKSNMNIQKELQSDIWQELYSKQNNIIKPLEYKLFHNPQSVLQYAYQANKENYTVIIKNIYTKWKAGRTLGIMNLHNIQMCILTITKIDIINKKYIFTCNTSDNQVITEISNFCNYKHKKLNINQNVKVLYTNIGKTFEEDILLNAWILEPTDEIAYSYEMMLKTKPARIKYTKCNLSKRQLTRLLNQQMNKNQIQQTQKQKILLPK